MKGRLVMLLVTGVVAMALLSLVTAHAASGTLGTKSIGASLASVPACDSDGVSVVYTLSTSSVSSVTVGGISSACAGGTLALDVNNGTSNSTGSGTVPAGGGSMTVTLAASVTLTQTTETDIVITGP